MMHDITWTGALPNVITCTRTLPNVRPSWCRRKYGKTSLKHAVTQKNVVRQLGGSRENKQDSIKVVNDEDSMWWHIRRDG